MTSRSVVICHASIETDSGCDRSKLSGEDQRCVGSAVIRRDAASYMALTRLGRAYFGKQRESKSFFW